MDIERLRESGNPIISLTYTGDNTSIPLGELSRPANGRMELVLETEISDPGNQWGDRVFLSVYLDRFRN